jgi:hypothetical protein
LLAEGGAHISDVDDEGYTALLAAARSIDIVRMHTEIHIAGFASFLSMYKMYKDRQFDLSQNFTSDLRYM